MYSSSSLNLVSKHSIGILKYCYMYHIHALGFYFVKSFNSSSNYCRAFCLTICCFIVNCWFFCMFIAQQSQALFLIASL